MTQTRRGFKDDPKEYVDFLYTELGEDGEGFPGGGNKVSKDLRGNVYQELMWFD